MEAAAVDGSVEPLTVADDAGAVGGGAIEVGTTVDVGGGAVPTGAMVAGAMVAGAVGGGGGTVVVVAVATTTTSPLIDECTLHTYATVPAVGKIRENVWPSDMHVASNAGAQFGCESNDPSCAVTVCGIVPSL